MNADRDRSEAPQDAPRAPETGVDAPETPAQGSGAERAAERHAAQPVQTATDAQHVAAVDAMTRHHALRADHKIGTRCSCGLLCGVGTFGRHQAEEIADAVVAADVRPPRATDDWERKCLRWRDEAEAGNFDALVSQRDALRAEVERLRKYAPSPEFQALLGASSLGSAEVLALRDMVPDDMARTIVLLARQMERAEAAEAKVAAVEALVAQWEGRLDNDQCPSCAANLPASARLPGCDHEEGYHHALSDLRAALSGGSDQPTEASSDTRPSDVLVDWPDDAPPLVDTAQWQTIADPVTDSSAPNVSETEEVRPEPSDGVDLIARERRRQVTEEGYTAEHDKHHPVRNFVATAIAYLGGRSTGGWPIKRADDESGLYQERDLVKAGALIAAAIDRLRSTEAKSDG